jgi:predicted RNA binding protein YcfA (HicA-like mRNA interferase family)
VKSADLLRRIRRLATKRGWTLIERQGKGSHLIVILDGRQSSIPRHGSDIKKGTFYGILRDFGLTERDLEDA